MRNSNKKQQIKTESNKMSYHNRSLCVPPHAQSMQSIQIPYEMFAKMHYQNMALVDLILCEKYMSYGWEMQSALMNKYNECESNPETQY